MPTITFSYPDFERLLGRKLPIDKFADMLLLYAKGELGKRDAGEVTVELDDTNLPYLWCPEGLARLFRGMLGMRKGPAPLKIVRGSCKIIVDDSVKSVRPYITAFVAKGKKIDDYTLRQMVQMQEKFCEGYGRRRQKVSIGLYSHRRISFPVHYKAVVPESVKFTPLEFTEKLDLRQILERHPKGRQYGWILKDAAAYPLLADDKGEVLSFPPIINSNFTGRLEVGDSELLFEATGTDEESISLAANIFAQNLSERGFEIHSAAITGKGKTARTPARPCEKMKITPDDVERLTGLRLTAQQINALLEKMGYSASGATVAIPHYRADIMHMFDIIEDVAIAYGFDRIEDQPLSSYTVGKKDPATAIVNPLRKAVSGMGFQEVFSHILTDKNALEGKNAVELQNFMSETYSVVRNSLLPGLLDVLSRNKHADYPQKIFEEGIAAEREGSRVIERHMLAMASSHAKACFTEMKQSITSLLSIAGAQCAIQPAEHPLFMKGRAGSITVNGKAVGIIGEVSPSALEKWGIAMPVAAVELDLSFLL